MKFNRLKILKWIVPTVLGLQIGCFVIGSQATAQIVFDGNPTNVSFVTNGANANDGLVSTGSATDPLFYAPSGGNNSSGFSSTADIETLNGASILATDTVELTLFISGVEPSPEDLDMIDPNANGSGVAINTNGIEIGFAPAAGSFRPANHALVQIDGRGSSDIRTNLAWSDGNIFGAPNNGGTIGAEGRELDGITEESLADGFTLQITVSETGGFDAVATDIVTTNSGDTSYQWVNQPIPAGTDFVDFINGSYFYVTTQGGGQHNVGGAVIQVCDGECPDLVFNVDNADFNSDGDVDGDDFLTWQRGVGTTGMFDLQPFGDANGDEAIDGLDLTVWQNQYPTGTSLLAVAAVPEPGTFAILVISIATCAVSRRRS